MVAWADGMLNPNRPTSGRDMPPTGLHREPVARLVIEARQRLAQTMDDEARVIVVTRDDVDKQTTD